MNNTVIGEYLDTIINGHIPIITLPTRLSKNRGTLIDNFFIKIIKKLLQNHLWYNDIQTLRPSAIFHMSRLFQIKIYSSKIHQTYHSL